MAVSEVLVHPRRLDTIISSAADGSVRVLDTNTATTFSSSSNMDESFVDAAGQEQEGCYTICAESSAVTSMDCDNSTDVCTLLVGSVAGGVTRVII